MSENDPQLPPSMQSDPEGVEEERARARQDEEAHVVDEVTREALLREAGQSADKILGGSIEQRRIDEARMAELKLLESLGGLDEKTSEELAALQRKYGKM